MFFYTLLYVHFYIIYINNDSLVKHARKVYQYIISLVDTIHEYIYKRDSDCNNSVSKLQNVKIPRGLACRTGCFRVFDRGTDQPTVVPNYSTCLQLQKLFVKQNHLSRNKYLNTGLCLVRVQECCCCIYNLSAYGFPVIFVYLYYTYTRVVIYKANL